MDDKYVVVKRDCLGQLLEDLRSLARSDYHETVVNEMEHRVEKSALDDAVVLRLGDVFAGPALAAYSAGIAVAENVVRLAVDHPEGLNRAVAGLTRVADYFEERAAESIAYEPKLPD